MMSNVGCLVLRLARSSRPLTQRLLFPASTTVLSMQNYANKSAPPKFRRSSGTSSRRRLTTEAREALVEKIASVNSVEKILTLAQDKKLETREIVQIMQKIGDLCNGKEPKPSTEEIEKLLEDERFNVMANDLHKGAIQLATPVLLQALSCLLQLTPKDFFLIHSLETQVLWELKKMSVGNIFKVLEMHYHYQETDTRKATYANAMKVIERRWVEIKSHKDVISLMYMVWDTNQKFTGKLEERALDLIEQLTPKDMCRVFHVLSQLNHRNTPLLRSLAYHLRKSSFSLSTLQIANLLHACSTLSYFDQDFLESISANVLSEDNTLEDPSLSAKLLKSLSTLRYRNTQLLDVLNQSVLRQIDKVSDHDLSFVLMTCANLDYLPTSTQDRMSEIVKRIQEGAESNPKLWLDTVWSLVLLNKATHEAVQSVLEPEFYKKLQGSFKYICSFYIL